MLVDFTKEELRALSEMSLEYSNLELSEEGTEFWTNIHLNQTDQMIVRIDDKKQRHDVRVMH